MDKKNLLIAAIRALASKLVEQWLKTVKGEQVVPIQLTDIPQIILEAQSESDCNVEFKSIDKHENNAETNTIREEQINQDKSISHSIDTDRNVGDNKTKEDLDDEPEALPVLKIKLKDGKQVISQVDDDSDSKTSEVLSDSEKTKDKLKSRNKDKSDKHNSSSSKSSSSSKHSSRSHSSDDKHKSSHRSSSSRHNSSKDRSKEKDRHSSHSSKSKSDSSRKSSDKSSSSSSSKSREDRSSRSTSDKDKSKNKGKEDKSEKSKDNSLNKSSSEKPEDKTPSVHKLGKIPKLSDVKKDKPSISIEVRKPDEPKPKTVKTFNSKFRKHGLEEEVKPPPSRAAVLTKKSTPILPPTVSIPKRPSPVHNDPPPEKKPKTIVETVEKPGAIKLIPPKPKRKYYTSYMIFDILLIISFFPDLQWWWQILPLMSPSVFNSLGCYFYSGKSKMYNLTGSKVFLPPVKYFFQINIEFNMNLSVLKILTWRLCLKTVK